MKKTRRCYLYGSKAQGICPFDTPGGTCRECAESLVSFGNPQDVTGTDSVKSDRASAVTGEKKSALRTLADGLKKRALLLVGRFNVGHNRSPIPATLPPQATNDQPSGAKAGEYPNPYALYKAGKTSREEAVKQAVSIGLTPAAAALRGMLTSPSPDKPENAGPDKGDAV
jgi:hypothetical protein